MSEQDLCVSPAGRHDLDAVASLLARAFAEDVPMRAFFRGEGPVAPERHVEVFRGMLLEGPLASGTVDVVRDSTGGIAAAAVWHARGASWHGVSGLRRLADTLHALACYWRGMGAGGLGHAMMLQRAIDAYAPSAPYWYLKVIGVDPDRRGQGLGGLLLSHRLRMADEDDLPAYLESSSRRTGALYRRHGFVPVRSITPWAGGQPWAMWRERVSLRGDGVIHLA